MNTIYERIKIIVIDVDGTMTDGSIYYDEFGNELKKFNTRDAAGFFAAKSVGIKTMVLTGRSCKATERRMKELKIDYLFENIKDKFTFIKDICEKNDWNTDEIAYIGDDLNDLDAMRLCGFTGCPKDACEEVKKIADYECERSGGAGAVREFITYILKQMNKWDEFVLKTYESGR